MIIEMNAGTFGDAICAEGYDFSGKEIVEIRIGTGMSLTISKAQAINLRECLIRLFPSKVISASRIDVKTFSADGGML